MGDFVYRSNNCKFYIMKNLYNFNPYIYLAILGVLAFGLFWIAPFGDQTIGGILIFIFVCYGVYLAYKKYNKDNFVK